MQMYNNKFGGFPLNNAWCRLVVGNVMTPVVFDVKRRLDMLLPHSLDPRCICLFFSALILPKSGPFIYIYNNIYIYISFWNSTKNHQTKDTIPITTLRYSPKLKITSVKQQKTKTPPVACSFRMLIGILAHLLRMVILNIMLRS